MCWNCAKPCDVCGPMRSRLNLVYNTPRSGFWLSLTNMTTYALSLITSVEVLDTGYVEVLRFVGTECENAIFMDKDILKRAFFLQDKIQPFINAKEDGVFHMMGGGYVIVCAWNDKVLIGIHDFNIAGHGVNFSIGEWYNLLKYLPSILFYADYYSSVNDACVDEYTRVPSESHTVSNTRNIAVHYSCENCTYTSSCKESVIKHQREHCSSFFI